MKRRKSSSTRRSPTSIDVAKVAGVSRATVGFVLNETPGKTISQPTRQRVLKAADTLGYYPNAAARTLRKGTSNEIAIFATSPETLITGEWTTGVQTRACELGYHVAVYYRAGLTDDKWRGMLVEVLSKQPAGVIAAAHLFGPLESQLLRERNRALVFTNSEPVDHVLTVIFDIEQAARIAGKYLTGRGHRNIALAHPSTPPPGQLEYSNSSLRGLESVLESVGGLVTEFIVDSTIQDARKMVRQIWSSGQAPTAVYAHHDEYTLLLLKALLELGLQVPADVAVISVDDSPICQLVRPTLTSVSFHLRAAGCQAVDVVDALIHRRQPKPELLILPPPELIIRESS